jgi:hypothetical protein
MFRLNLSFDFSLCAPGSAKVLVSQGLIEVMKGVGLTDERKRWSVENNLAF